MKDIFKNKSLLNLTRKAPKESLTTLALSAPKNKISPIF